MLGVSLTRGGTAAMTYGQAVQGGSSSLLLAQRRAVAAAEAAEGGGKNLDLSLMFAEARDPAFEAHEAPIGAWALAVWQGGCRPPFWRSLPRALVCG